MVLEHEILPFLDWLNAHLGRFAQLLLIGAALGLVAGFLFASIRHGPVEAARLTARMLATGLGELCRFSPRRIGAIARLAVKEALRRKVLVIFGVFAVLLLFAGWYLDRDSEHPARLYISFVISATQLLILLLAIFLSAFSLPNDIRDRTIHTVVTKPVRGWEIVLGRVIGFSLVSTVLLSLMCVFSYGFVVRGLRHTHVVTSDLLKDEPVVRDGQRVIERRGVTSMSGRHRHNVVMQPDGRMAVSETKDHTHYADQPFVEGQVLTLGAAVGQLLARVPVYGQLRFLDRMGNPAERGVDPGYESKYRSYIEGGTFATAIWTFEGIDERDFPDGLPLEMTIRVFRTYQGKIGRGIQGTIQVAKPARRDEQGNVVLVDDGRLRSARVSFTAQEYTSLPIFIPRKLDALRPDGTIESIDLFRDLVDPKTGRVEIWIRCSERAQYFGMASADLYLRAADRAFAWNFVKSYLGIWLQMVVVTGYGVGFSTFLSGPVAMVATVTGMLVGYFHAFIAGVASGRIEGGGPLESFVRLVQQKGALVQLEPSVATWSIQTLDKVILSGMQAVTQAVPDVRDFNTSRFVAYGFDIPGALLAQHLAVTGAYVLVAVVAGYFFFRTREIAA